MKKLLASLIGLSLLLSLTGCILGPRDEKQAFIDATVEATCHIFQAKNLFDPAVEQEAKDIYKKYGFDADNQAEMEKIANNYAADEEVKNTIMDKIKECSAGIPGLEDLQAPVDDEEVVDDEAEVATDEVVPADETVPADEAAPADETAPAEDITVPATDEPAVQ